MPQYVKKLAHLPPDCGADLHVPLLFNPYQQNFQQARRARFCLNCKRIDPVAKCSGYTGEDGRFICPTCKTVHVSNLTAPRVFDRLLVLAGRGGGKTLIGAHAAREEIMVPNSIGWVMGATHKILHDSTFPTLVRLIPPDWIKRWDPEHMELSFKNGSLIAFRSLQDNPDRARGPHGVGWGWFDEAAQCPERAYDVFTPTLIKAGGIVIATTTVLGYDWTYDKIEKHATAGEPGFFAVRYWTEENPLFASNPVMKREIERAKATMSPEFYAQEYKAERRNAEGLVYDYARIEAQCLDSDDAVRAHIPEWPAIDPSRPILIGLDEGADHPFGAVKIVVTPTGLIQVDEYLKRMKAISEHRPAIMAAFGTRNHTNITWAANKNALNLRLEFAVSNSTNMDVATGIQVVPAESKQEIGIQRISSWLHAKQLFFVRSRCPMTIEQTQAYRYIDNLTSDGQKKDKEAVFKKKDELPDSLRYAVMAYPELPQAELATMTETQQKRWDAMDERTRYDIERVREYNRRESEKVMSEKDELYPIGEFFGGTQDQRPW